MFISIQNSDNVVLEIHSIMKILRAAHIFQGEGYWNFSKPIFFPIKSRKKVVECYYSNMFGVVDIEACVQRFSSAPFLVF